MRKYMISVLSILVGTVLGSPGGARAMLPCPGDDSFDLDPDELGGEVKDSKVTERAEPALVPTLPRGLTLSSYRFAPAMTGHVTIDHRAFQKFNKDPFEDGLGLDSGALKIGLGLRFAPLDFLELHAVRMNGPFDTYEFGVRGQVLDWKKHFVSIAAGASLSWFSQPKAEDATGFNGELVLGRPLPYGVEFNIVAMGASQSSSLSKSNLDKEYSIATGGSVAWRIPGADFVMLEAEYLYPVAGYTAGKAATSFGVTFLTWRHSFSMMLTNAQLFTMDSVTAGSERSMSELVLGFCIVRQFGQD